MTPVQTHIKLQVAVKSQLVACWGQIFEEVTSHEDKLRADSERLISDQLDL